MPYSVVSIIIVQRGIHKIIDSEGNKSQITELENQIEIQWMPLSCTHAYLHMENKVLTKTAVHFQKERPHSNENLSAILLFFTKKIPGN